MRILHTVEFYHPSVGGAQEVVKQISEGLVRRGHDVTVATTRLPDRRRFEVNGVKIAEFDVSGNLVYGIRGTPGAYRRFVRCGKFDVMMSYAAQQWACDASYELIDELPYATVMAPCGFSGLQEPAYAAYFQQMPNILKKYDRLIFHSDTYQDRRFAQAHGLEPISRTIANAASESEFTEIDGTFRQRYGIPSNVPMLLMVASHTGVKGHDIAIKALAKARIGGAVLALVGNSIRPGGCLWSCRWWASMARIYSRGQRRVMLLDLPRRDVVAAYHAADLFVFPSVVECSPLVLFECMAAKLPFVASPAGNSQEIAEWSGSGVIVAADRRQNGFLYTRSHHLAAAIERMLGDRDRLAELGERGHQIWRQRFTWDCAVDRYEQVYREAIDARQAKRAKVTI